MSLVLGEPAQIGEAVVVAGPGFTPTFISLILSGCVLTWSQFLCAAVCSAITTSMVGVAKSVIQTILGFFTFGGVRFHPLNIAGQSYCIFFCDNGVDHLLLVCFCWGCSRLW